LPVGRQVLFKHFHNFLILILIYPRQTPEGKSRFKQNCLTG